MKSLSTIIAIAVIIIVGVSGYAIILRSKSRPYSQDGSWFPSRGVAFKWYGTTEDMKAQDGGILYVTGGVNIPQGKLATFEFDLNIDWPMSGHVQKVLHGEALITKVTSSVISSVYDGGSYKIYFDQYGYSMRIRYDGTGCPLESILKSKNVVLEAPDERLVT